MSQSSRMIRGRSGRAWIVGLAALAVVFAIAWLVTRPGDEAHALTPEVEPSQEAAIEESVEIEDGGLRSKVVDQAEEERVQEAVLEAAEPEYVEWSDPSWREMLTWHEPTELAGLVLRGKSPVADARVRLWGDAIGERPRGWGHDTPGARETRSDAEGSFLFTGLPAGSYSVRADDGEESMEVQNIKIGDDEEEPSVLILFGRATIEGSVHSDDGLALPGKLVRVHGIGPLPSRSTFQETDADGNFRFTGLTSGRFHVVVMERTEDWDFNDERLVRLEIGGHVEVRFGHPQQPATVLGRVMPGNPSEDRDPLRLVHAERGDELRIRLDEESRFELRMEPGTWHVYEPDRLFQGTRIGSVEVTAPRCEVTIYRPAEGEALPDAKESSDEQGSK